MNGTLLHSTAGNGNIEKSAPASVNLSFRGTADDNAVYRIGHKSSQFEQDDSGEWSVHDGDDHASDKLNDTLSSSFKTTNGEDGEDSSDNGIDRDVTSW